MRLKHLFFTILLMSLGVSTGQAAVTSYDNTFVANDVFASDFHTRLNANFTKSLTGGINNISTANIVDDTLTEADFADEINPRVRTYEGAACEFVYTGLIPATDSDLTSDISAGTAYPRGYRVNKSAATAHTYTASKWTYVDIDQNGDFQYSEVAIGGAAPSVASNSIRLAKVSSDSTTINTVTDLRRTSCANGPFSNISSSSDGNEPNLDDVLKNGIVGRRYSPAGRTTSGFIQGYFISYDTATTFTVTSGAAYINGEYRTASTDITVPRTADDPSTGVSGIVSGAIGASTNYYIYLVGDYDSTKTPSVSFGTAPTGLTNYKLIGQIKTDATSLFTSRDIVTAHALSEREIVNGWINFNGTGTIAINDSYNVSGIADNGTGNYTISWDSDFNNANYAVGAGCYISGNTGLPATPDAAPTAGTYRAGCTLAAGALADPTVMMVLAIGDSRK